MSVVCCSRIDFDELSFDQPTKKDDTSAYTCAADLIELKLCGLPSIGLSLSLLCGTLTGQHCKSLSFSLKHCINFDLIFWNLLRHSLCVDQRPRRRTSADAGHRGRGQTRFDSRLLGRQRGRAGNESTVVEHKADTIAVPWCHDRQCRSQVQSR